MKIDPDDYRVQEGQKLVLKKVPTKTDPLYSSKKNYDKTLANYTQQLSSQQELLYASNRYSLLLMFQAMDAAGKDSTIKSVMSGVNPQGCQVTSFKHPSATELEHDFLWRSNQHLPQRGMIGIFNRSYYEEVLIVRVHPELLLGENLPDANSGESIWPQRYRSITELESHLVRNGTRIMKFFLHVSKDEQRKRFLDRIDTPEKNWKFNQTDLRERQYWDEYMSAYQQCLSVTSTTAAPWYVIPADDKDNMRLIVSRLIVDTLASLKLAYPQWNHLQRQKFQLMREQLAS